MFTVQPPKFKRNNINYLFDKSININKFNTVITEFSRTAFHMKARHLLDNPNLTTPLNIISKGQWIKKSYQLTPHQAEIMSHSETLWHWLDQRPNETPQESQALLQRVNTFHQLNIPPSCWDATWDPMNDVAQKTFTRFSEKLKQYHLMPESWIKPLPYLSHGILTHPDRWQKHQLNAITKTMPITQLLTNQQPTIKAKLFDTQPNETQWLLDRILQWHQTKQLTAIITPDIDGLLKQMTQLCSLDTLQNMIDIGQPMSLKNHPITQSLLSLLKLDTRWLLRDSIQSWSLNRTLKNPLTPSDIITQIHQVKEQWIHRNNVPQSWDELPIIRWIDQKQRWQNEQHSPLTWLNLILEKAKVLGWPHHTPDQHTEFVKHKIIACFHLWQMPHTQEKYSFNTFMDRFELILEQQHIQLTHDWKPITVLRPEEAVGLNFEHIHFINLTTFNWPPKCSPPHWLPSNYHQDYIQTQLGQVCALTTLLKSAPSISLSHHEDPLWILPIFQGLNWSQAIITPKTIHPTPRQENEPPIRLKKPKKLSTTILKHQSQCPFKAFVTHRLKTPQPNQPQLGLQPADRGALLHELIEMIHHRSPNCNDVTQEIIHSSINKLLNHWQKKLPTSLTPTFKRIEQKRLSGLIHEWLEHEKTLTQPTTRHLEYNLDYSFNKYSIPLRVDRIDEHADGSTIIDYKTGYTNPHMWFEDRLTEPQLPIYALSYPNASKLLIYRIHHLGIEIKGITHKQGNVEGINLKVAEPISWESLKQQWNHQIQGILEEYIDGCYEITPSPSSCQYCHLLSVCRLDEHRDSYETN
ncbi:MAG: PD-(D/E)XK nuclease family protein [Candidatus Comchoanobacterales bacterium]